MRTPPEVDMPHPCSGRSLRRIPAAALACVVLTAVACGPSSPALTDPVAILQAGASSLAATKSFHLRGAIDGEIDLDIGGFAAGAAPLPLDGTTLDGDVDVGAGELAVEIIAPALLNMRLNIVVADGDAYLRAPIITGDGWVRQPAEGGFGADPAAALVGLGAFLARPELAPQKLSDTRCGGADCYSVSLTVPGGEVREALGSLGDVVPGLSGDGVGDVTVTVGIRRDDLRLATLGLEIPTGSTRPLSIALELSKVDEPVTITPPPADEVNDAPGG